MRNLALLFRVQLLALLNSLVPTRSGSGKQRKASTRIILVFSAVLVLAGIAVVYMAGIGISLTEAGYASAIPVLAVLMGSIAGIAFTFMKADGTLFGMADYDLVMSLPFPRRTIVASRMGTLFLSATLLGAVFMVPLYAVYFSHVGIDVLSLVAAVLSVLLGPAIPTSLAIFVSFGLTAVAARFRHANLVYIVFTLVALVAFVLGSYSFSFSASMGDEQEVFAAMAGTVASMQGALASVYPPAGLVANAVTNANASALIVFLVISLAIPAACLEIMQRNYLTINGLLASGNKRGSARMGKTLDRSARTSSPFKALVIKELRTQIGIPTYAINCLFGYLLMIMLSVALTVVGARDVLEASILERAGSGVDLPMLRSAIDQIFLLVPWFLAFCAVVSPTAAVSISLEGRSAWLMATAPVSMRTIVGAKLASNVIPMAAVLTISTLVLLFGGQIDLLGAAEALIIGSGLFYAVINLGMLCDARRPNFAWSNAQDVVKRSMPIMVCVIGGMVIVFGLGAAALGLSFAVGSVAAHVFGFAVGVTGLIAGQLLFAKTCRKASFYLS